MTDCSKLGPIALAATLALAGCGSPHSAAGGGDKLPPTPTEFAEAKTRYDANCGSCHDTSREGAPRLGYLAAWKQRLEQGEPTLVLHAIEGKGLMPPKGDNPDLSDENIAAVVSYMVYRAGLDIPAGR